MLFSSLISAHIYSDCNGASKAKSWMDPNSVRKPRWDALSSRQTVSGLTAWWVCGLFWLRPWDQTLRESRAWSFTGYQRWPVNTPLKHTVTSLREHKALQISAIKPKTHITNGKTIQWFKDTDQLKWEFSHYLFTLCATQIERLFTEICDHGPQNQS